MAGDSVQRLRDDKVYQFSVREADASNSLYLRVADDLIQEVAREPGKGPVLLPQERDLAIRFQVSRSTIRQALSLLEQYDLVQRRRGHGTVLTKPAGEALHIWGLRKKFVVVYQFGTAPIRANSFYGRILAGMASVARTHRQNMEVKYCFYPGEVPRALHVVPDCQRVAGVIISGMYDDKFLRVFSENGVPCVSVDYWPHDSHCDAVTVDVEAEAFQAASHLAQCGYRTVGYTAFGRRKHGESVLVWDPDVWRFLAHLRRATSHYGLLMRDEWVQTLPYGDHLAQKSLDRFFMLDRLPEAMICYEVEVTNRALEAMRHCGKRCPQDMGLVTRGSTRGCPMNTTTLECPEEAMGRIAMQLMLERLYQQRKYPVRVALASQLVPGESTAQVRVDSV